MAVMKVSTLLAVTCMIVALSLISLVSHRPTTKSTLSRVKFLPVAGSTLHETAEEALKEIDMEDVDMEDEMASFFMQPMSTATELMTTERTTKTAKNSSTQKIIQKGEGITTTQKTRPIKVVYRDLSSCPPRPKYLTEYKAHCWRKCFAGKNCSNPIDINDIKTKRARNYCVPNLHLIGIRKSGTTDFSYHWFSNVPSVVRTQQDYWASTTQCPVEYFSQRPMQIPPFNNGNLYNGGPGVLMSNTKVKRNDTHLVIASGVQFLGYMAMQETRFYLQLRNPTDRVISYLFHWLKKRRIPQYKNTPISTFTPNFTDTLLGKLQKELEECLVVHGDTTCVYLANSHDGYLETLLTHSLYVVFVEELFKWIPQRQVLVKTMDEYSRNRVGVATTVIKDFFGVQSYHNPITFKDVLNKGSKKPVLKSTLETLDNFYAPYNKRLADLLQDDKFLFRKTRL